MAAISDRRAFIKAVLGSAAGVSLSSLAISRADARAASSPIAATPINDRLTLITGAGGNVVAARGTEGALLVDGGLTERSGELLKVVSKVVSKERASRRVHTLFNTHWHPEQTGSNERLGNSGTRIIAHENTKLWLGYENAVLGQNRTYGPLPPKARPNDTTYGSGKITFDNEQVEYGYLLQAHTDGDIYVFFPESNVLVTGGAVSGAGWPMIDYQTGGWIGGVVEGLKTLIARSDAQTRIVPANGPLLTRADLESQRDMYAAIYDRLQKLLRKGMGPQEVIDAAPTKEFDAKWGDSQMFVTLAFKSLWGHFAPDA
jgi:glyoxylase-like metal-dependent hydrolase (beta-lactamase superfamily II)